MGNFEQLDFVKVDLSHITFKWTQNRTGSKDIDTFRENIKRMKNIVFYKAPDGYLSFVDSIASRRLRSFHFGKGNLIKRLDQFEELEELGVSLDGTDAINLNEINRKFNRLKLTFNPLK